MDDQGNRMSPVDAPFTSVAPEGPPPAAPQPDLFALDPRDNANEKKSAASAAEGSVVTYPAAPPPPRPTAASSASRYEVGNNNNNSNNRASASVLTGTTTFNNGGMDDIISGTVIAPGIPMQPNFGGGPMSPPRGSGRATLPGNNNVMVVGGTSHNSGAGGTSAIIVMHPSTTTPGSNNVAFTPTAPGDDSGVQGEWDIITEITQMSHKLRILYVFESIITIICGISFPYFFIALPFAIIGYCGARWFRYWMLCVAFLFVLISVPLVFVDLVQMQKKEDDGFTKVIVIILQICVAIYHCWVGYVNYKLTAAVKEISEEQHRQLLEMPPTCGCL